MDTIKPLRHHWTTRSHGSETQGGLGRDITMRSAPPNCPPRSFYEASSPTTATARSGLGYCIYYKYTLRPPLWIPLVLGEVRSFRNLRDDSRLFYPLDYHARGTRSSSTGSIWIFLRNAACYGFGARRARAADIRILAYRDIAMGVKFDSEASWILDKDP